MALFSKYYGFILISDIKTFFLKCYDFIAQIVYFHIFENN